MAYCNDIEGFTTYVIGERDIKVEDIQVNIDDGQNVIKVISLWPSYQLYITPGPFNCILSLVVDTLRF